jgi:hypothetical protein
MENTLRIKGTESEMVELFNNSNFISIRFYQLIKLNTYNVVIRHNEDIEKQILSSKTVKRLLEINKEGK